MGARHCGELGINLQKIIDRLMANDELVKLLYYEDKDPLNGQTLTTEAKRKEVYEKLIKVVPKLTNDNNSKSKIVVYFDKGIKGFNNSEFINIGITVDIFVPLHQWFIKDSNLRPFAIMGEIQKSLDEKTINGLGKLECGDFNLKLITDEMSCYTQ